MSGTCSTIWREAPMKISQNELDLALKMAFAEHWDNGLPEVPAKLRLVINSLMTQANGNLPRNPSEFIQLIKKKNNRKIRRILTDEKITEASLAFAIRDALS